MQKVQETEKAIDDSRWIVLRVSRINLAIDTVGVLMALVMLALVPLAEWVQIGLGAVFLVAFVWDLRLVLLKAPDSVGAFYLFDLDVAPEPAVTSPSPQKLGIRVRYALKSGLALTREAEGVVVQGAFVSPWFTALRYALPQDARWRKWWPHIIPIWPDSVDAESFRRMRVALRWK